MRRSEREVTDHQKILEILECCDCCRLGINSNGAPYIVPLNFGWEENDGRITLYFHCAVEGRKLDLIRLDPRVSFQMDRKHELVSSDTACTHSFLYQCIMGTGTAEILTDHESRIHGLTSVMSHYTKKDSWTFDERMLARVSIIRLNVDTISCKEH